jgi:hypothetical protein
MSALTKEDFLTPTWLRLKEHYEVRLIELRTSNDRTLAIEDTAKLRGRIAEVKNILALDRPPPAIAVPDQGANDA